MKNERRNIIIRKKDYSVSQLAVICNMSPSFFTRIFVQGNGCQLDTAAHIAKICKCKIDDVWLAVKEARVARAKEGE